MGPEPSNVLKQLEKQWAEERGKRKDGLNGGFIQPTFRINKTVNCI